MDGMWQDIIIMMTIGAFGLWVITKHYDNAWKIEQLEIKVKKNGKIVSQDEEAIIKDFRQMQTDIIKLQQDCINIDAKYKIKDEWTVSRLQQLADIVQQNMSLQDAINTFDNAKELVKSYEKGAGIASSGSLTMSQAADMESDDV